MCGIAGYVAADGHRPEAELLPRMCALLTHRGPDAGGYFRQGAAGLGHRRLSIIDVAGGDQPLGNEDGRIQIVFNGEIYNFQELRAELVKKGHRFETRSDTEVLVHLYEEVGARLPEFLNGMFAFAIWDSGKQELFLARDRFGKKPLYYTTAVAGFRICFASELKSLAEVPGFDRSVDATSVADFLRFSYVPDPRSIYESVRKLGPAHSLLLTSGGIKDRRYWRPAFDPSADLGAGAAGEQLLDLALDSVERRMISDVPLGGFLSGGVDSSAVVSLMAERASAGVKSFSIGFTNEEFDELEYARLLAKRYHTEHHEHVVTPSIEEILRVLVKHFDEPFADSSAIPTLYLARMTREHVTVALSGDGADELFGGYRRYRFAVSEERVRRLLPAWFRRPVFGLAAKLYPKADYLPRVFRAKATLKCLSQQLGGAYFSSMTGFGYKLYDQVLSSDLKSRLNGYSPRENYISRFEQYRELTPLQQLQAVDLDTYLPGDILVKLDRATMAYSLESRCPWLDYRFGDMAGRLSDSGKLHRGVGKYVLKASMRSRLPAAILDRPKMGFSVPMAEWMRTSLRGVFHQLVFREEMAPYLNLAVVRKMWNTHQAGRRDYSRELWAILMLACWDERFQGRSRGAALDEAVAN